MTIARHIALIAAATVLVAGHSPPTAIALDTQPATISGQAFGPEQTFVGDYRIGGGFRAAGAGDDVWLTGWRNADAHGLYHVRFVGRQSLNAGHYGRQGAFRQEVILTRLVEAHPKR